MGARWAWFAKCAKGHVYSGFSGGADDCGECGLPPIIETECPHLFDDNGECDCAEELSVDGQNKAGIELNMGHIQHAFESGWERCKFSHKQNDAQEMLIEFSKYAEAIRNLKFK